MIKDKKIENRIKYLIRKGEIYHNKICDFYVYKEKVYYLKESLIAYLKKER